MPNNLLVQYGCGLSAPPGWINFDASPTLRLQRLPLVGQVLTRSRAQFPRHVRFGDVVRGLPIEDGECRAVYASHIIEHLSLDDARFALRETRRLIANEGRFRIIVPDLEVMARRYVNGAAVGDPGASTAFMLDTRLGHERRQRGLSGLLETFLGNANHLWMWDQYSLEEELRKAGFTRIRPATFGDSEEPAFRDVEAETRFRNSVAFEASP